MIIDELRHFCECFQIFDDSFPDIWSLNFYDDGAPIAHISRMDLGQ